MSTPNLPPRFAPAFRDTLTGEVFPSVYASGEPAPIHLLDSLPELYITCRGPGQETDFLVSERIEAGFLRDGRFYTRSELSALMADTLPLGFDAEAA